MTRPIDIIFIIIVKYAVINDDNNDIPAPPKK